MNKSFIEQQSRLSSGAVAPSEGAAVRAASSISSSLKNSLRRFAAVAAIASVGAASAYGADKTYNFSTDPASDGLTLGGNNTDVWVQAGGNPGGFLAITYPIGSQKGTIVFPNLDPGKIVTGFTLTADLRIGNPTGDRAADGFSISFARDGDSLLQDANSDDFGGNCCAETGTKTGIAVSFDTWSGNTFPADPNDTSDIEGLIVRVDNVTVKKVALPTRNGACDDITSLQTGPRDKAYWDGAGDPKDPGSWAGLCWQPFKVDLKADGKLTVEWKNNKVLDAFQTTYFPSAGQLVLSGRTGGANENTHIDNIHLVTIPATVTAVPGAVPTFSATEVGARRVKLAWGAATVAGDANAKVAYELLRDGVTIQALLTTLTYEDKSVQPGKTYAYTIRAKNIAGNAGPDKSTSASTLTESPDVAFLKAEQWTGIGSTGVDAGTSADHFLNDPPDRVRYVNGFSFGETSNFGDTWGDNHLVVISGVLTAPKTGNFRFFVRSDDASALFFNDGAAIPDYNGTKIAEETGCCNGFQEPDNARTSEPIPLVAGKKYGLAFYVKEGGGGDWGQVAIREEGDPTPANALTPLRGSVLAGVADPVGATIAITTQPKTVNASANDQVTFSVAATGSSPYGADYGNAIAYQWYVGGSAVLNANGPSYVIPYASAADNGKKVYVVAAVAGASVKSDEVTLNVSADTTPPTVADLFGSDSFDKVTVTFSEPVTDPTATSASSYKITGLTVNSATRVNAKTIVLGTSKQAVNTTYPVIINGVKDNAGLSSAYTGSLVTFQLKKGLAAQSDWEGQTGGFNTFVDNGLAATPPNAFAVVSNFAGNDGDQKDNYFRQTKALFTPAKTGNYVFFMASDDHGELYLSTDADPANKKMIAQEPSWGGRRYYVGDGSANNSGTRGADGSLSNRSDQFPGTEWPDGATVKLTANKSYYLELLYKEGGGGDHGSATFIMEGDANPANSGSALTGDLISWYVDPTKLAPVITQRPQPVLFSAGDTITFSVKADSALPVTYKWYHTKHLIASATTDTLTIPNAGVADIGDYYVEVSNKNGTATSFPDNDSRANMKGAFVVEVEDFNYDGGKTIADASKMPLKSGLYEGKDGLPGIDIHLENQSTGDGGANGNNYRQGWTGNVNYPTAPEALGNADVVGDDGGGGPAPENRKRPDFDLTNNYKIGWGNTGEWYQYTRDFPAGTYAAVAAYSRDGRDVDNFGLALELVSGDPTKVNAATTVVGEIVASGTGSWSSDDLMSFSTPGASSLATFTLGANTTVRLRLSKNDPDIDYLLFYKVSTAAPQITAIKSNADGSITIEWTGGGTLQASPDFKTWQDVTGAKSPYTFTPAANAPFLFGRIKL